ncbi:hypothetical protein F5Y12DRAFT_95453 [Xylaria sp. FL1777]|nr:hypothetical protein F5Y12DRAFT_95453 [Xylaria sp. FL1777]
MGTPSANNGDDIQGIALEESISSLSDSKIIFLRFAAEDEHGYKELQLYEQNLVAVPPSFFQRSSGYILGNATSSTRSDQQTISRQNNIVYFDVDIMEELELYQTGPLQQVTDTTTVAVHWRSLCTRAKLEETLMSIYSRLRNIQKIIIAVDHHYDYTLADNAYHPTSSPGLYDMPHGTLLEYEHEVVNWCTVGREIQQTIRNQLFWRGCNAQYADQQILPMRPNPPRIPQIHLMRISRNCDYEGDLRLPSQLLSLIRDLAPEWDDIDELWDPEQPEVSVFTDLSVLDVFD